jgi:uncharacterized protein (TIGR03034 family)
VEGAAETYPRQKIVYKVTEYSKKRNEMSAEDKEKVKETKWAVKIGIRVENLEEKGDKITLDIDKDWGENRDITIMAYIDNIEEAFCKTRILKDQFTSVLIRGVVGEDESFVGREVKYEVTNSNKDGEASKLDGNSNIHWAIKIGKDGKIDKEMLAGKNGEIITLAMDKDWANKEITVMPYLKNPTETVSVKTMVHGFPMTIARSNNQPGKEGAAEARDMHCGDKTKDEILNAFLKSSTNYILDFIKFENADFHFKNFECMATTLFARNNIKLYKPIFPIRLSEDCEASAETVYVNLESNIISMIEHFKNGGGKNYSSNNLTIAAMCHENTIKFINDIRRYLLKILKKTKENLIKVKEAGEDLDEVNRDIRQPAYNSWTDKHQGLTIAVNGIWAYEAWITQYKLNDDGKYEGVIKIAIYDHFGLDDDDVGFTKAAQYLDGFYHWYVLQRWEGFNKKYKPFITVIEKDLLFEGEL